MPMSSLFIIWASAGLDSMGTFGRHAHDWLFMHNQEGAHTCSCALCSMKSSEDELSVAGHEKVLFIWITFQLDFKKF